jgi:hypothetical protein
LSSLKKANSIHVSKYANDYDDEASLKSEKSRQKFKYQINLTGSLNYKENKFSNLSPIKKSLNSTPYEKKSHDTMGNSRKKLASQKHVESFCSSSISSSSSSLSINTSASSSFHSKTSSQRKSKTNLTDADATELPNVEKLKITESNDKQQHITKQVYIEMVNDKNRLSKNELEQKATNNNKTVIDRIKKFTPSVATNSSASSMMPTLSSEFNSKLNKFINAKANSIISSNLNKFINANSAVKRTESSERQVKCLNIINNKNKIEPMVKSKDLNEDILQHAPTTTTTTSADEIKIESNKVKDIIKCFNSIEKRTSDLNNNSITTTTTITASNANTTTTTVNNSNSNKQNISQSLRSNSHNENHESPIPFPKSDQNHATLDVQSLNSKAKFIANNITKLKSSISFSQNGKLKLLCEQFFF